MFDRKLVKERARKNLKEHYFLFLIACLVAAYLGCSYSDSLSSMQTTIDEGKELIGVEVTRGGSSSFTADDVLTDIINGQIAKGNTIANILNLRSQNSSSVIGIVEFGHRKGILSGLVNNLQSGKIFIILFEMIDSIIHSTEASVIVFIVIAGLISLAVTIFLKDSYDVAFRRIFLESYAYEKVKPSRFLFLFRVKRFIKASLAMFVRDVIQFLWDLTIIGGVICGYNYFLVPYIIAENPDINWKKALKLSGDMMFGHKWECFKLQLSFILWDILGVFTLGLSKILFSNLYEECTYVEYYVYLRNLAKEKGIENVELLNDKYLYEKADLALVEKTYKDIIEIMNDDIELNKLPVHTGLRGFCERNLGLIWEYDADEDYYNVAIEQEERINDTKAILALEAYPGRLFTIKEEEKDPRLEEVHYLRHYSIWTIIAMFFIFAFIGWSWEVTLHLVKDGVFVNRGTMHGPWLPIYGFGGVMILLVLFRFRNRPALEATSAIVLCGVLEYFTHLYLEITKGTKWWDYSGYFLNINGRICAEGLLVFMIGGMAVVNALGPVIDNKLRKVNQTKLKTICIVLLTIFIMDSVYSSKHPNKGAGITDYDYLPIENQRIINKC